MSGGGFFNPTGVLSFSNSSLCSQLCPSSMWDGPWALCPPFHPLFLLPTLSCRCLGEDALRAIRPPPCEACLSLSAFLSVPRAKDALEAQAHSPSLHSEPAAAICQLLLFPKKPKTRDRPRSERQRTPKFFRAGGMGRALLKAEPPLRLPRPLCSPFPMFFGWTADVPAPVWSSPGNQLAGVGAQRYWRAVHPGVLPARGSRGAEAPTAIGNVVLASPAMPLTAQPGSLGIYIIILLIFFLVRQYCAFSVTFFSFGGKK